MSKRILLYRQNRDEYYADCGFEYQNRERNEIKHAARVLSRYRDARRTRILRIRLRLTVRVNKRPGRHDFFRAGSEHDHGDQYVSQNNDQGKRKNK